MESYSHVDIQHKAAAYVQTVSENLTDNKDPDYDAILTAMDNMQKLCDDQVKYFNSIHSELKTQNMGLTAEYLLLKKRYDENMQLLTQTTQNLKIEVTLSKVQKSELARVKIVLDNEKKEHKKDKKDGEEKNNKN